MAETALEAQQQHEAALLAADIRQSWVGMACGFVIAATALAGAIVLVLTGHDVAGATIGTVNLGALVSVFITDSVTGRRARAQQPPPKPPAKKSHAQQEVEPATEA